MRTVVLKILKNKLSECVRLVAAGETIVVTDRNRVVAEIVPPRTGLTPFEEQGAREGWPRPAHTRDGTPPPHELVKGMSSEQLGCGARSRRSVIYIDSSMALAHLLVERRSPPASIWNEPPVASQLLEYEVWHPLHAYGLGRSHADEAYPGGSR
jgi:antitoxin (DNA-binding transcriptional repressor) of toxin-antitoxin stability system